MTLTFASHVAVSEPPKFVVDQRHQLIERVGLASAPGRQQLGGTSSSGFRQIAILYLSPRLVGRSQINLYPFRPARFMLPVETNDEVGLMSDAR